MPRLADEITAVVSIARMPLRPSRKRRGVSGYHVQEHQTWLESRRSSQSHW